MTEHYQNDKTKKVAGLRNLVIFCILRPVSRLIINESYNLRFETLFTTIEL